MKGYIKGKQVDRIGPDLQQIMSEGPDFPTSTRLKWEKSAADGDSQTFLLTLLIRPRSKSRLYRVFKARRRKKPAISRS